MKLIKTLSITLVLCAIGIISCDRNVTKPEDLQKQQFEFAASILYNFFIFQDRLPQNPYRFETPQEIYLSVNDPYTRYYPKDSALLILNYWMTTKSGGIGIRMDSVSIGYVIRDVFKDSPGKAAGLLKGDTITEIDGVSIANVCWDTMSSLIRGDIGESVNLTIKRDDQRLSFNVTRGEFNSPSVFIDSLASNVAYIYLSEFLGQTNTEGGSAREFKDALDSTSWAEHTIFDLRQNGGGEIDQCIEIVSEFVPSGTSVMEFTERVLDETTWESSTQKTVYKTEGGESALSRKFVILADTNTASASEILISCVRSNRSDIKVIGEHTYGKACGQVLYQGPDTVLAKVTYATLKPINGESYDHVGLMPDIAVSSYSAADTALSLIAGNVLSKTRYNRSRIRKPLTDVQRPWIPLLIVKGK